MSVEKPNFSNEEEVWKTKPEIYERIANEAEKAIEDIQRISKVYQGDGSFYSDSSENHELSVAEGLKHCRLDADDSGGALIEPTYLENMLFEGVVTEEMSLTEAVETLKKAKEWVMESEQLDQWI